MKEGIFNKSMRNVKNMVKTKFETTLWINYAPVVIVARTQGTKHISLNFKGVISGPSLAYEEWNNTTVPFLHN